MKGFDKLYASAENDQDWMPATSSVLKLLVSLRVSSALWCIIGDCDEVYNYWEPLHLFLYGHGFQTWEYSPLYAIRSYLYIYIHYVPASIITSVFYSQTKIAAFVFIRCVIGTFTIFGEYALFRAISEKFNVNTGRLFLLFTLLSTGMFISGTAFLPSSFAMTLSMYSMAAYITEKWAVGIACTALSAMVGWPFSAVLGLPIVVEMVYARAKELRVSFIIWSVLSAVAIGSTLFFCDSYYFGRRVFAPLNIVIYNVLSGPGPELYGIEPMSFYVKNLLLNWNIAFPLAVFALPICAYCFYIHFPPKADVAKKMRIPSTTTYWRRFSPVFLIWVSAAVWCVIFFSQPHKEERFLFPIYPHIAVLAALALDGMFRILIRFSEFLANNTWVVIFVFVLLSLSRTYSLYNNFGAHIDVYKSLSEHLMSDEIEFANRNDPLRVCVGKEWHRFPSSFFIPEKVIDLKERSRGVELQFLESEFRGLLPKPFIAGKLQDVTRAVPTEMNDQNIEEKSRYVPLETCDFVVDLDLPATEREPNFREKLDEFEVVAALPFLVPQESHPVFRAFFVPFVSVHYTTFTNYTVYRRIVPQVKLA